MNFSAKGIEILIEEIDLGAEKILKNIEFLEKEPFVKVGVLESDEKHKKSKRNTLKKGQEGPEPDSPSVAQIAHWHEYGVEIGGKIVIPERSFIRSTMFETEADLVQKTIKIFDQILDGKLEAKQGLNILGLEITKNFKKKIDSNIPPALAESTIKAKTRDGKAGNVALVDTGQMRNSIQHLVVEDGKGEE